MKNIKEVKDLRGKRVLLRLSLNVPIEDGAVANGFRIEKSLPVIKFLKERGAKVLIISHIGRTKTESLKPVFDYLKSYIDLTFVDDVLGGESKHIVGEMKDGDVVMFENLRQHEGEVGNDISFTKKVAQLGDIYINEAFSVSHRMHSSIVGLPKFLPSYSGILFDEEIRNLSRVFDPSHPFLFILGGNKLKTKLPLIKKFLNIADTLFIGGAPANNFFLEKGFNIGDSMYSNDGFGLDKLINNPKIMLPVDVMVKNEKGIFKKKPEEVEDGDKILDSGTETVSQIKELIKKSKFVLWNGPLGDYTLGFKDSTLDVARIIAESDVESVIGGGDTLTVISELNLNDKFSFLSTGGGAMLEFLVNETLPGMEALESSKN